MSRSKAILFWVFVLAALSSLSFTWPWDSLRVWPQTSEIPVTPLENPTIEDRLQEIAWEISAGYRFVVFGDQRALANGEWQELITHVAALSAEDERLLFIFDTGDIVGDGAHGDQFEMLREILGPVRHLPYLVAVGNHELESNRPCPARANTAAFLSYLDAEFSTQRMYYRKDIGPVRFLFMDGTDLVRGDAGELESPACPAEGSRARGQMEWLVEQLEEEGGGTYRTTVVGLHNPLIQSSKKHRRDALTLWKYEYDGRRLPDILLDGGVDLVLVGNTHTYERFLLRRSDGRQLRHINISGRPRTDLNWFRDRTRRPKDISGREGEWLTAKGWQNLAGWEIVQEEAMTKDAANQFGLFTVEADGGLLMETYYLDPESPTGTRRSPRVRVK
jgi:hypothetical protein